jgi:uncharacterized protein (TIGR00369 family)
MSETRDATIPILDTWPYARFLGLEADIDGPAVITRLPFAEPLVGNVMLPAVHGGVVAAFLELTALIQLAHVAPPGRGPRTVDTTVDYLRSTRAKTTFGKAEVLRIGRRVANVRVLAWQDDETRPVATLRGHFEMVTPRA